MKYLIIILLVLLSSVSFAQTTSTTLNGSGSYDPDGVIVSYKWTKISGPSCVITNPNSMITTVTGLKVGTYVFRLTVTDNKGATGIDDLQVIVKNKGKKGT